MGKGYPAWILYLRRKSLDFFNSHSVPRWMVFVLDAFSVFIIFVIAYLLRFNFNIPDERLDYILYQGLIAVCLYSLFSLVFRSYSGLIRHATLTDLSLVFLVTTCSTVALLIFSFCGRLFNWSEVLTIPLSIILIHFAAITVFMSFGRVFIKLIFRFVSDTSINKRRVLIYGAGELGFTVKRVILSNPNYGLHVTGFIDNDKNYQGKKINGIPVYGISALSTEFLSEKRVECLILAKKDIKVSEKSLIIRSAIKLGIEVLDTPEVDKWLNGQLHTNHFERIKLEDLLGREPIKLDMGMIRMGLVNKTIMITGAAGSIGSEIVRQLTRFNMKRVILVDQAETPLFFLQNELREKFINLQFHVLPADVTNLAKMDLIFQEYRPDVIFHAAAYKHVSLMEENPHEAIRVNVGGTKVVTELAMKYNVGKFVMISTDKSVNPTSVMGASKRLCEKVVQSKAQKKGNKTQFIITRFGNVLGSNGSVIPLFTRQIERGGPVTVTHPDIYRYFMTIPEACQLVLEAGFMGIGGEIFVFDMGQPVKIVELANAMIQLSGLIPGKDIQIVFTGLRPGEKLYEELLTDKETTLPTYHPKIKKAQVEDIDGQAVLTEIHGLLNKLYTFSQNEVVTIMKGLIPEYKTTNGKFNISEEESVEDIGVLRSLSEGEDLRADGSEL
jgi:FlaA1/EpsC-like NDP-sugar epimerase